MTSLASIPGIAVEPMWSTRNAFGPQAIRRRAMIRRASSDHVGLYGTSLGGLRTTSRVRMLCARGSTL